MSRSKAHKKRKRAFTTTGPSTVSLMAPMGRATSTVTNANSASPENQRKSATVPLVCEGGLFVGDSDKLNASKSNIHLLSLWLERKLRGTVEVGLGLDKLRYQNDAKRNPAPGTIKLSSI